jgi:hypothetical protein
VTYPINIFFSESSDLEDMWMCRYYIWKGTISSQPLDLVDVGCGKAQCVEQHNEKRNASKRSSQRENIGFYSLR